MTEELISMRLLVTGASGFLGSHFVSFLNAHTDVPPVLLGRTLIVGNHETVLVDSFVHAPLESLLSECSFDGIVHCAAISSAYECETHPEQAIAVNRDFSQRLAQVAANRGVPVCYISTDLVFDGAKCPIDGFQESDQPKPSSQYARSKYEGELAVLEAHPEALILRSSLLYGSQIGTRAGFLGWMKSALSSGEQLSLFDDEWRTPLYAPDLCRLIFEGVMSGVQGVYHCAGPERLTRYDFGLLYANHFGFDSTLIYRAQRGDTESIPPRPEDVSLNIQKTLRDFSTSPHSPSEAFGLM